MEKYTILVADDEDNVSKLLALVLKEKGYRIILAKNGQEALAQFKQMSMALVLMDIRMPEMDGLTALRKLKEINKSVPIILMTAYAGVETAVDALKLGAFDYIIKPFDLEDVLSLVKKALDYSQNQVEDMAILDKLALYDENGQSQKILTNSPLMMALCRNIAKVSQTSATVLITGESGVGKELVAKAIHYHSPRSTGPFIKVNCGALPETLLESALFGHEKGAFTGAQQRQLGLFERANHGTLFLDEVGEMSASLQVKLLRVLQEREFEPLGSHKTIQTDFRLIAATNRNLHDMVKENRFRMDLFYRLNVMPFVIPPLRKRPEDIALLANYFVQKFCTEHQNNYLKLTPEAEQILEQYSWPGNVRELSNAIEHAVVMSTGMFIYPSDLPNHLINGHNDEVRICLLHNGDDNDRQTLKETMKTYEREVIHNALRSNQGHRELTAKALGVSKRTLLYKIQEYEIDSGQ